MRFPLLVKLGTAQPLTDGQRPLFRGELTFSTILPVGSRAESKVAPSVPDVVPARSSFGGTKHAVDGVAVMSRAGKPASGLEEALEIGLDLDGSHRP